MSDPAAADPGRAHAPPYSLALAVVSVVSASAWVALAAPKLEASGGWISLAILVTGAALAVALGLTIVARAAHEVGWALLALALALGFGAGAGRQLVAVVQDDFLRWVQAWAPFAAAAALALIALLFPDGRLVARRRIAAAAAIAGAAVATAGVIVRPGPIGTALGIGARGTGRNPTGVPGLEEPSRWLVAAGSVALALGGAASLAILARRTRVASGPERGTMLWVLLPMLALTGSIAVAIVAVEGGGQSAATWQIAVSIVGSIAVPAGLAVAVVKDHALGVFRFVGYMGDYRIWTAATAIVAIVVVIGLAVALPLVVGAAGEPVAVAIVAVVATIAVTPWWRSRQTRIDRRFGQRQPDPARELERFGEALDAGNADPALLRGPMFDLLGRFAPIVVVDGVEGMRLAVPTADREVGRHTFVHGAYDLEAMRRAVDLVGERGGRARGSVFVDVGANIGTTTVAAIRLFHAASVVAVEPAPRNLDLLRLNLQLNHLGDLVHVVPLAASDREGFVELELSEENSGDNRIRESGSPGAFGEERWPTIEIPVRKLDDVLGDLRIDPAAVGLVWVDVQGHEGHVLAGAERLLAAGRPVVSEFWPYALRRAGGFDVFCDRVRACFRVVIDLRADEPSEVESSRVSGLARDDAAWFTDLLLLP